MSEPTASPVAGQVAVITGASRGIGAEIARAFRRQGMRIAITARGMERLERLAQELDPTGSDALAICGDIGDPDHCRRLIETAEKRLGPIDVLVNNAGEAIPGKILESNPEDVEFMVRVNFLGAYYCTRFALPKMVERGSGHIILINSIAGIKYTPGAAIYSATKFAMRAFGESLRNEVQTHNIKVSTLHPGMTATTWVDPREGRGIKPPIEVEDMLTSEDVAAATVALLGLPDRVSISTVVIRPTKQER